MAGIFAELGSVDWELSKAGSSGWMCGFGNFPELESAGWVCHGEFPRAEVCNVCPEQVEREYEARRRVRWEGGSGKALGFGLQLWWVPETGSASH